MYKYYVMESMIIPVARPARNAAPRLVISACSGRSSVQPVRLETSCIRNPLLDTPPSTLAQYTQSSNDQFSQNTWFTFSDFIGMMVYHERTEEMGGALGSLVVEFA